MSIHSIKKLVPIMILLRVLTKLGKKNYTNFLMIIATNTLISSKNCAYVALLRKKRQRILPMKHYLCFVSKKDLVRLDIMCIRSAKVNNLKAF